MRKLLFPILMILMTFASCDYAPGIPAGIGVTNQPPAAYVDSISPTEASLGETVSFIGHGTDPDGIVVAYRWRSSIDGDLSTFASFDTSSLSAGVHTIYLKVQDDSGDWSEEVQSDITISGEAVAAPVINSFGANPGSVTSGESSVLSWDISGATAVTIDQGIGNVPLTGTRAVSPVTTTTYVLTATNEADSVTARARVTVSAATPPVGLPIINSFTANPGSIMAGGSSILSWAVSNAQTVMITYDGSVASVGSVGSAAASPVATTTYTLTATNAAGSVTATVQLIVSVAPPPSLPVINSFAANPGSITLGASSTLSWNTSGATIVSINQGIGIVALAGIGVVSPAATTTYTLTATNAAGSTTATVQVVVSGGGGGGDPLEGALFNEVNARRANPSTCNPPPTGPARAPLVRNSYLDQLARNHSQYVAGGGTPHDGFASRFSAAQAAIGITSMAENVLMASQSYSASQMVDMWCSSSGHHDNMLNSTYTRTGMGIAISGGYVYATQIFTD